MHSKNNNSANQNIFDGSRYETEEYQYSLSSQHQHPEEDISRLVNLYAVSKEDRLSQTKSKHPSRMKESKPKLAIMRNCIIREGKDSDVAREHKVLTSSQHKRKLAESRLNRVDKQGTIKTEGKYGREEGEKQKQKIPVKQEYYRFCTQQIVRVSNRNTELQEKLREMTQKYREERKDVQKLRQENDELKQQLEETRKLGRERQTSIEHLRNRIAEEQKYNIEKTRREIEHLGQNRRAEEAEMNKYMVILAEKEDKNNKLLEEIRGLRLENLKLVGLADQNIQLSRKITELVSRNQDLERRAIAKSEVVDHLWNVKEIQYSNIVDLIGRASGEFDQ